jgi:hypothetical protein
MKQYQTKHQIDKVVDMLYKKGVEVLDWFEKEEKNYVNNETIDVPVEPGKIVNFETLELYNVHDNGTKNPKVAELFKDEIEILKHVPGIDRAMYLFIGPNSVIPSHADDDDPSFRVITTVMMPGQDINDCGLDFEGEKVFLDHKVTMGSSAYEVVHHGWNNTDKWWSILVLGVNDDQFKERIRTIY